MKHATHTSYIAGFLLSVLLTLAAYFAVAEHWFAGAVLVGAIAILAIVQLMVQLVLFLHLGSEPKPRLNLTAALFAGMVVVIVVFGSIWIMNNLNYNMSPSQMEHAILQDEGLKK